MALPTKTDLEKLDTDYLGFPFVFIEAKPLATTSLDVDYLGMPFVGAPGGATVIDVALTALVSGGASTTKMVQRVMAVVASSAAARLREIGKSFSAAAGGGAMAVRGVALTLLGLATASSSSAYARLMALSVVAVAGATTLRRVQKNITAAASSATVLVKITAFLRRLTATATGTPYRAQLVAKVMGVVVGVSASYRRDISLNRTVIVSGVASRLLLVFAAIRTSARTSIVALALRASLVAMSSRSSVVSYATRISALLAQIRSSLVDR